MIKLSRLTDYAIVLLSQMAMEGQGVCAASDLAEKTFLPLPTTSKVLKQLTKAGLLKATRGAAGGYQLAKAPHDISMAMLIEAMDGPIAITECASDNEHEMAEGGCCSIADTCALRGNWTRVNQAIRAALDAVSLAEMTNNKEKREPAMLRVVE